MPGMSDSTLPTRKPASQAEQQRKRLANTLMAAAVIGGAAILLVPQRQHVQQTFTFDTHNRPILGKAGVGAEIVVLTDYKCPYCKNFELTHLPIIERNLVTNGKAHVVFLHTPFLAKDSMLAAISAECAYQQSDEAFLKYNRLLFQRQGDERQAWATPALLAQTARDVQLNMSQYSRCLQDPKTKRQVDVDFQQHQAAGFEGTPTVFVNGQRTAPGVKEIKQAMGL